MMLDESTERYLQVSLQKTEISCKSTEMIYVSTESPNPLLTLTSRFSLVESGIRSFQVGDANLALNLLRFGVSEHGKHGKLVVNNYVL